MLSTTASYWLQALALWSRRRFFDGRSLAAGIALTVECAVGLRRMKQSKHRGCVGRVTALLCAFWFSGCGDEGKDRPSTARNDETDHRDADRPDEGEPDADVLTGRQGRADGGPDEGQANVSPRNGDAGSSSSGPIDDPTDDFDYPRYDDEPDLSFDGDPLFSGYVRLTHRQWVNSVVDNLRLEQSADYAAQLPSDLPSRYSNNESVLFVNTPLVSAYQSSAESIAAAVALDPAALDRITKSRDPQEFVTLVGQRFYRRPLSSEENAKYLALYETGASLAEPNEDSFAAGVRLLLEAWMQAPAFLYRIEQSTGLLEGFEIATRLAYALTDTGPSDELLEAAGKGELDTAAGVHEAALQLLETSRARTVFGRFHYETFGLDRLKFVYVHSSLGTDESLRGHLTNAAYLVFERVLGERLGLRQLLLSDVVYVNQPLATLYGVQQSSTEFQPLALGAERSGVFAQLPFLMLHSSGESPNAFQRGAMLVGRLLCQETLEHPVGAEIVAADGRTNRERSEGMVADAQCQACHRYVDPFGFAFENFDGLGRLRAEDNGQPVDTSGTYPFSTDGHFENSQDLMKILSQSPLAHGCYTRQLTEFTVARSLSPADETLVAGLASLSLNSNAPLLDLVAELVSSERFRSFGGAL